MALQGSGQISLNDLHVEAGGSSGTQASMNDSDIRGLLNASANSQMAFNSFYGASAGIGQIASGNSFYSAGGQYSPPSHDMVSTLFTPSVTFSVPYITNRPTFTMNNRDTQFARLLYDINSNLILSLFDLSSSSATLYTANTAGVPANSGFTRMKLKNSSGTVIKNLTRSSATYAAQQAESYNNSASFRYYSNWSWASQTNPFPASSNTTLFTIELE